MNIRYCFLGAGLLLLLAACGGTAKPEAASSPANEALPRTATPETASTEPPASTPTATPLVPTSTAIPSATPLTAVQPTLTPALQPPAATPLPPTPEVIAPTPPSPPPPSTPTSVPPPLPTSTKPPAGPVGAVTINISAANLAFNRTTMKVAANTLVTVNFQNNDTDVFHDFGVALPGVGHTQTCTGPCFGSTTFNSGSPGSTTFQCSVHPDMVGPFIVE